MRELVLHPGISALCRSDPLFKLPLSENEKLKVHREKA